MAFSGLVSSIPKLHSHGQEERPILQNRSFHTNPGCLGQL